MTIADEAIHLMQARGGAAYFGEPVSQLEHALQTAHCATEAGSPPELVVAALLHDIGHLLHGLPESVADAGVDTRHETAGYEWLSARFGPAVAEPVRDHVAAKRYLCRIEPAYPARLSAASLQSLQLQGGPFNHEEASEFEARPHYRQAVMLRRWDDEAKIPGLPVPPLGDYRELLLATAICAGPGN
jgi:phosphonate degradation associated HDIG domain protein